MSDIIKVDTGAVVKTAKNIARYNERIKDDFSSVETAIKALNNVWDGKAASTAVNSFYDIKNAYSEPRYNLVNNFVNFLHQQVGSGYTETEKVNTSLADAFK